MGDDARVANIDKIGAVEGGFDVVVVCTGNQKQADYWQQRLDAAKGTLLPPSATVVAVEEDWPGGAGNGLGTFYAYTKACAAAKATAGLDIPALLAAGSHSVGLFHTAGKGTRLAPLPASENNNKPGVKLPVSVKTADGSAMPLSILESVIKQTGAYATSRKGRLSVFWGDQIFIPSVQIDYVPSCHVDILCTLGPMADEEGWTAKGLQNYGLIAVGSTGAAQVEKVSHAQATKMLAGLGDIESVGVSLGSFSLSHTILAAFLKEFETELAAKSGKLDTDPHLWMPLTLKCADYCELMATKGVPTETSEAHHARMAAFFERFAPAGVLPDGKGLFGAVDIGTDAYWWDYGQLKWYLKNNLMLTAQTEEAAAMRRFFGIVTGVAEDSSTGTAAVDDKSCVSASQVSSGTINDSVVCHANADHIECEGSIIVGVTGVNWIEALCGLPCQSNLFYAARSIKLGKGCVIYNVADDSEEGITLSDGQVLVGVVGSNSGQTLMRSHSEIDGGKNWKVAVEGNPHSFEELHAMNQEADILDIEQKRTALHRTTSGRLQAAASS